ncbi:MAG: hypothetical protein ACOY3Y_08145 [Acidobacteriota bacterium]
MLTDILEGSSAMSRSTEADGKDFGADGIDIQTAMVRHVQTHPDRATRPKCILWNGEAVWTSFDIPVVKTGVFRIEFLSDPREPAQGVDVKVEGGAVTLPGGEVVPKLRTWHEPRYEKTVAYPFKSKAGLLKVWNVYHRVWPDGRITEEKWTGNAGFIVKNETEDRWLFRCSNGPSELPDFDQLVFRFTVCEV